MPCGETCSWSILTCQPPGPVTPTTDLIFLIPDPGAYGAIYFFFADDCVYLAADWTSVPFLLLTPPCPVTGYLITAAVQPPELPLRPTALINTSVTVA